MDNLCFKSSRSHVFRVLSECSVSPSLLQYHILVKTYFFSVVFLSRTWRGGAVSKWLGYQMILTNQRGERDSKDQWEDLPYAVLQHWCLPNLCLEYVQREGSEECWSLAAKHKLHFRLYFKYFWEIKFTILVSRGRDSLSYCILQFL